MCAKRSILAGCCLWAAALLASVTSSSPARAEYPDHPIQLVVPFAAGAALEVMARVLTPELSRILGQPIVVINKPGADGMIGLKAVSVVAPDGYTLVLSGGAEVLGPSLHKTFPYDPTSGLQAVALVGRDPFVVAVSSQVGVNDFKSFADYAKKNTAKINAAASGNSGRIGAALLGLNVGFAPEIVSFDGNAQATTSVATGESDFSVQGPLSFASFARSGRLKIILVAGDKRLPTLPDVPTAKEEGIPDFAPGTNAIIYAPSKTPANIVNKVNEAVRKTVQNPEIVKALAALEVQASDGSLTPDNVQQFYLDQLVFWKNVVSRAKIPTSD